MFVGAECGIFLARVVDSKAGPWHDSLPPEKQSEGERQMQGLCRMIKAMDNAQGREKEIDNSTSELNVENEQPRVYATEE